MLIFLTLVVIVGGFGIFVGVEPRNPTAEQLWILAASCLMMGGGAIFLFRHLMEHGYDG